MPLGQSAVVVDVRVLAEPASDGFSTQLAHARAAEVAGFSGWFRSEHLLMGDQRLPGTDALLVLAAVATATSSLRLGTLMSPVTFREPGQLAVQVAQLDAMSDGRIELGLGAGWHEAEHRAFGVDFGRGFGERFDRLEEQLEVLTGLWTTQVGETYSHAGRRYKLDGAPAVRTVQDPHVPVIIGGQGRTRTPRLAATYANEFNALRQTPDVLVEVFDRIRCACEAIGRDPDDLLYSTAVVVCCGEDSAAVDRRVERSGQDRNKLAESGAVGSVDEVIEKLHGYVDAGADRIYLRLFDLEDLDQLALLGEQVLPAVVAASR